MPTNQSAFLFLKKRYLIDYHTMNAPFPQLKSVHFPPHTRKGEKQCMTV